MNFLPIIVAALIPSILGFIYYNPKVFGTAWMDSIGKTEEELQKDFNMPLMMGISLVLSFLLAFAINALIETGHRDVNEAGELIYASFHTFKHGALHGALYGLLIGIPILVTNGIFERKTSKNLLINSAYWVLTCAMMGGLLDAWN